MTELFNVPESDPNTVGALRAALDRAVDTAKKEARQHQWGVFIDEVEEALDLLAIDGDKYLARSEIRSACEMDEAEGMRACAELFDHVDIIAAAWLRLARAERSAK